MVDLSQLQPIKTEAEAISEMEKEAAAQYLKDTAWLVVESLETGKPVDKAVSKARAEARAKL